MRRLRSFVLVLFAVVPLLATAADPPPVSPPPQGQSKFAKCVQGCAEQINNCSKACMPSDSNSGGGVNVKCAQKCQEKMQKCIMRCPQD
jgi:hypothetical protein